MYLKENNLQSDNLIVFLHGNSMSSEFFDIAFEKIKHANIIAPDIFGHGKSRWLAPNEYSIFNYVDQIKEQIEMRSFKKLVLIGHSFGGNLACQLLAKLKQVDGVMLLSAIPINYQLEGMPYLKVPKYKISGNKTIDKANIKMELKEMDITEDTLEKAADVVLKVDPIFRERLLEDFAAGNFKDEQHILLQQKTTKKAIAIGSSDSVVNREYLEKCCLETNLFDKQYIINKAGHFPFYDNPDSCIKIINDFVEMC